MNSKSGCIIITGSSKGIGLGLAQAFLEQQQAVVISGRNSTDLQRSLQQLQHRFPAALIQPSLVMSRRFMNYKRFGMKPFNTLVLFRFGLIMQVVVQRH